MANILHFLLAVEGIVQLVLSQHVVSVPNLKPTAVNQTTLTNAKSQYTGLVLHANYSDPKLNSEGNNLKQSQDPNFMNKQPSLTPSSSKATKLDNTATVLDVDKNKNSKGALNSKKYNDIGRSNNVTIFGNPQEDSESDADDEELDFIEDDDEDDSESKDVNGKGRSNTDCLIGRTYGNKYYVRPPQSQQCSVKAIMEWYKRKDTNVKINKFKLTRLTAGMLHDLTSFSPKKIEMSGETLELQQLTLLQADTKRALIDQWYLKEADFISLKIIYQDGLINDTEIIGEVVMVSKKAGEELTVKYNVSKKLGKDQIEFTNDGNLMKVKESMETIQGIQFDFLFKSTGFESLQDEPIIKVDMAYSSSKYTDNSIWEVMLTGKYRRNDLVIYCQIVSLSEVGKDCGYILDMGRYTNNEVSPDIGLINELFIPRNAGEMLSRIFQSVSIVSDGVAYVLSFTTGNIDIGSMKSKLPRNILQMLQIKEERISSGYIYTHLKPNRECMQILTPTEFYEKSGRVLWHVCKTDKDKLIFRSQTRDESEVYIYSDLYKIAFNEKFVTPPKIGLNDDTLVVLNKVSIDNTFTICQHFQPSKPLPLLKDEPLTGTDEEKNKKMYAGIYLDSTVMVQCYYKGVWSYKGRGEEVIWNTNADIEITTDERSNQAIVKANVDMSDMFDLITKMEATYVSSSLQQVFPTLGNFEMTSTELHFYLGNKEFIAIFFDEILLPGFVNSQAEAVYYKNQADGNNEIALCLRNNDIQISEFLSDIYNEDVLSTSWMELKSGSVILSKTGSKELLQQFEDNHCNNVIPTLLDIQYKSQFPEFKEGMLVIAKGLNLQKCSTLNDVDYSPVCHFLFKANSLESTIDFKYGGVLNANGFLLLGDCNDCVLEVGKDMKMKITKHIYKVDGDGKDSNIMKGSLRLTEYTDNLYVELTLEGQDAFLSVPEQDTNAFNGIREAPVFDYIKFTRVVGIVMKVTNYNKNIIELKSDIQVGTVTGKRLKAESSNQFINVPKPEMTHFWACISSTKLEDIFAAFGLPYEEPITQKALVSGCFVHHNLKTIWKLSPLKIHAEQGMMFYGHVTGQRKVVINLWTGKMIMHLIPWEVPVSKRGENHFETRYMLTLHTPRFLEKDIDGRILAGPVLIRSKNNILTIKGYIKLSLYKGVMTFEVNTKDGVTTYKATNSGVVYALNRHGRVIVVGLCNADCNDFSDLDITTHYQRPKTQRSTLQDTAEELEKETGVISISDYEQRYKNIETKYHEKREELAEVASNATQTEMKWKIERGRAIQAASKSCIAECPTTTMPAYELKNCYVYEKTGKSARCLTYNPHKVKDVSDVTCLSKCEAERAISFNKAKSYDDITMMKASEAAKKRDIAKLYSRSQEDTKLNLDLNKQKEWLDVMKKNTTSLKIHKMDLVIRSNDTMNGFCFMNDVDYTYSTDKEEYSKSSKNAKLRVCYDHDSDVKFRRNIMRQLQDKELNQLKNYVSDASTRLEQKINQFLKEMNELEMKRESIASIPEPYYNFDDSNIKPFKYGKVYNKKYQTKRSFERNAPWIVQERNDPVETVGERRTMPARNTNDKLNSSSCEVARDHISEIHGMLTYVKRWLNTHQKNVKDTRTIGEKVQQEMDKYRREMGHLQNTTQDVKVKKEMNLWFQKTEEGMKKWIETTKARTSRIASDAPNLIKDEILHSFIGDPSVTLETHFDRIVNETTDAFKRMTVSKLTKHQELQNLSKGFVKMLGKDSSLRYIKKQIDDFEKLPDLWNKRSLVC